MGDSGGGAFVAVLALVVVAALVGSVLWTRHREKLCRAWAGARGWTYVGVDQTLVRRWHGAPFGIGHSRVASEVVTGLSRGRAATSFTYRYTTGHGKNRQTTTHHVVAVTLPAWLSTVTFTNDGVGAKIAKAFGGQDLDFESEAFNRTWRVQADDPRVGHAIVHPRLMERLLAADASGMQIRIEGEHVLCWEAGAQDLDRIDRYLAVLGDVVDSVPRFVWLDHGYDPANT